jgi:hypothetical protein
MTHDLPRQLALFMPVAVYRTLGAGRLGRTVGAFLEPLFGVVEEGAALGAGAGMLMSVGAPDLDHPFHGAVLAAQAWGSQRHVSIMPRRGSVRFDRAQMRRFRSESEPGLFMTPA